MLFHGNEITFADPFIAMKFNMIKFRTMKIQNLTFTAMKYLLNIFHGHL